MTPEGTTPGVSAGPQKDVSHEGAASSGSAKGLLLGALGVVYGDIGTSPIYTLRESIRAAGGEAGAVATAMGVLSLVFWSLMIVVTLKYVLLVMRADNEGEGGIMALLSAALGRIEPGTRVFKTLLMIGVMGAALFYGDAVITPAISVLSAIEGLEVATPVLKPYVIPITIAILVGLFLVQSRGSARIGKLFGPVMVVWFLLLGGLGLMHVFRNPAVLAAADPRYALSLIAARPSTTFVALGSVFLAVTGGEALYADMGHFGRRPIRVDWFAIVLPALLLNYAGQAALVLADPAALDQPFFRMVPGWALLPLVVLSAAATIIASQAVISGAFSLTQQAMQLGLLPRLSVKQTSDDAIGQIYVPQVNWALMVCVIGLVLGFESSERLAAAYGIAVTGTMLVTTVLFAVVMRHGWGWGLVPTVAVAGFFFAVDALFFAANALKIPHGGWFPLLLGGALFVLMITWREGRLIVLARQAEEDEVLLHLLGRIQRDGVPRTRGTAIYLTSRYEQVPAALAKNLRHNGVVHDRVVFLKVLAERQPRVPDQQRVEREELGAGFEMVTLRVGFAEKPDVPALLQQNQDGLGIDPATASFFIGREMPVPTVRPEMAYWREQLYAFMTRNAVGATDYFMIPPERVVELGTRVDI